MSQRLSDKLSFKRQVQFLNWSADTGYFVYRENNLPVTSFVFIERHFVLVVRNKIGALLRHNRQVARCRLLDCHTWILLFNFDLRSVVMLKCAINFTAINWVDFEGIVSERRHIVSTFDLYFVNLSLHRYFLFSYRPTDLIYHQHKGEGQGPRIFFRSLAKYDHRCGMQCRAVIFTTLINMTPCSYSKST